MQKKYNIGLDIGTTSIGWAVVDEKFNIIKKGNKQKALWGVRLFDEAKTAAERRNYRSIRRRYDRRRERIRLLQEEFKDEIDKVDANFFIKMKESFFHDTDEINKTIILSKEEKETLKKYQNKYPTIYHLRKKLIINPEKEDIRLVYLAIHHIIKYRGNFNYNMDDFNINKINIKEKLEEVLNNIFEICKDIYSMTPSVENLDLKKLEEIFLIENKTDKKKKMEKEFEKQFHKKVSKEITALLIGNQANLKNLFAHEFENVVNINFTDNNLEEKLDKLTNELNDEIEILTSLKELYDMISLKLIFKNQENASISNLMVDNYIKHKRDLHIVKDIIRPYRNDYKRLFKNEIDSKGNEILCLYTKYTRNESSDSSNTNFIIEIKKVLENIINDENKEQINKILEKIENGIFMPKITDTSNGKFPYQLNLAELKIILENQGKYYPFLLNKIDSEYKIEKLLKFRIPYYIGPLVEDEKHPFAWMVRKSNEKITPYNFYDVVDTRKSAKKFIYRMIGKCTCLLDEYAIPSNSILYSKFKVINELKQIKINNHKLDLDFQHKIFEEFFLKQKGSLTDKKFQNYLRTTDEISMYINEDTANLKIEGYSADMKFANNMDSYIDFLGNNGIFENTNLTYLDAEKIIELITVFEDKEILKEEILELYPCLEKKINYIISKKYKGWSNLSKKLLETKYYKNEESDNLMSIMDLMWESNENFMQILNNKKYKFQEFIKSENKQKEIEKLDYSLVSNLATSPANKRGIYQTLKVINEIINYMGYEPENIIIEMARSNEKGGRVLDRRKQLLNLYDAAKNDIQNYKKIKSQLQNIEKIDKEKLLLYFLQEGKSLYSGKDIDINYLYTDAYEVDHILPQTLIKDDSIDNKALVLRDENQIKRANVILPKDFRNNKSWWEHLKKVKLMSNKKYNNLIRDKFTDKDIEGFINRQLVETRQITKHVANIINNLYKNSNVIYLKANILHNYRERFKLYKYRDLNDYHHAHDAYLASVLGIYQSKYLKTKLNKFEFNTLIEKIIREKRYDELKYGYVINSIDDNFLEIDDKTGEVMFDTNEFIKKIENTLYRNDILVSKKIEFKNGELYNQTKNKKNKAGVPLKKNLDTKLYGSYTSLNPAYALGISYFKKGNLYKKMIGIPIYIDTQNNQKTTLNYIKDLLELDDIDTIKTLTDKIPFYSHINLDGKICSLVGATNYVEICNAKEFKIEKEKQIKWKYSLNRLFNGRIKVIDDIAYNNHLDEILNYVLLKIETEYKLYENLVPELKEYINNETIKILSIEEKEKTLKELFKLLKFNSASANLKFLNSTASTTFGRKKGQTISNAIIVHKSTTGIKEYNYEF